MRPVTGRWTLACWLALSGVLKKIGEVNAQRGGDLAQVEDGYVAFAPLHRANKGPVQVATAGEFGLRPLSGKPMLPDALAQFTEKSLIIEVHGT